MEETERRKVIELLKEMRNESDSKDVKTEGSRLNWMYKGPSELLDKEEYLLGKAIDKSFEVLNNATGLDTCLGRTGEPSNVPRRVLEKTECTEQVDIAKKILEDPLYAIKQKEMEARKKLLNNPVKLKQIKQMLLERSQKALAYEKQRKKKLKKEKLTSKNLDLLLLKYLKKFSDKEKRKALRKITKPKSEDSSSDTSSSNVSEKKKKNKKLKRKRSRSSSSDSDSSSESTSSSERNKKTNKSVKIKKKSSSNNKDKKRKTKRESSSDTDSESEKKCGSSNKKLSYTSRHKQCKRSNSSSDSSSSDSTDSSSSHESKDDQRRKNKKSSTSGKSNRNERNKYYDKEVQDKRDREKNSRRHDDNHSSKDNTKSYGLMMPDGTKPTTKEQSLPVKKYEKTVEVKAKYVPPPKAKPLSDKEREAKLKEMMEDAKTRKADREKNLAIHRKKEAKEEDSRTYDDDFMRRQMSHLTSQGSMADRIKSNINNIQRNKSLMSNSFMKK